MLVFDQDVKKHTDKMKDDEINLAVFHFNEVEYAHSTFIKDLHIELAFDALLRAC